MKRLPKQDSNRMSKRSKKRPVKSAKPQKRRSGVALALLATGLFVAVIAALWFRSGSEQGAGSSDTITAREAGYEVVGSVPHDRQAFLQGLIWHDGFYESTGQYGESSLRRVEYPTGRVIKQVDLDPQYFGEGLAIIDNRLYQLTWQARRGFIYDRDSLERIGEFTYESEGWGLTYDGKSLILSDGSDTLTFIDPGNFKPTRRLRVKFNGAPLRELNELEYVEGEIWANVWHSDRIVRIDPASGQVKSYLDLTGILPAVERPDPEAVLNGIAYDARSKRIFVSGKLWPRIFEIRLK